MVWWIPLAAAGISAAGSYFASTKNKSGKVKQQSTLTKEQKSMMRDLDLAIRKGKGPLADIFGEFNQEKFNKGVKEPLTKQFQEDILPLVQEKFIGRNQVLGSGMRRGNIKAGNDFQDRLAALMYDAQKQHDQNKINGINTLLGRQGVENTYQAPAKNGAQTFFEGLAPGIGQAWGNQLANIGNTNNANTQATNTQPKTEAGWKE